MYSWKRFVSVLAGISITATPPPNSMFIALFDPFGLLLVRVGRIAEHRLSSPILGKSVVFFRIEFSALRRFRSCAGIKREMELGIKLIKELLRRCPIILSRRE